MTSPIRVGPEVGRTENKKVARCWGGSLDVAQRDKPKMTGKRCETRHGGRECGAAKLPMEQVRVKKKKNQPK